MEIWHKRSKPKSKNHWSILLWCTKKKPALLLGNQRNEVPAVQMAPNETLERSHG